MNIITSSRACSSRVTCHHASVTHGDTLFVCVTVQLGTLGAGNHYAEIQVVDEIYNDYAAKKMGIDHQGQVCVMIHSGSRGLGHQVATGEHTRGGCVSLVVFRAE